MLQAPIFEVRSLSKKFKVGPGRFLHAVDQVNFEIFPGEILGLIGESGSGKSTLGRLLINLHTATDGTIRFRGEDILSNIKNKKNPLFKQVQMIFQDPYSAFNPRMTVEEIIAEGPINFGVWAKSEVSQKVQHWLKRVGLHPSHGSRFPHEFSGGQRQRIGIARALAIEPSMIICDEPISALDVSVQAQIIHLLKDVQQEKSLTYLFIAHDLSIVRTICDRIAVMYLGRIVEIGPAATVYSNPRHPYTQALIAANPLPDPVKERSRERKLIQGEITSPVNPGPGCLFADRCPHAFEPCRKVTPILHESDVKKIKVACHLLNH